MHHTIVALRLIAKIICHMSCIRINVKKFSKNHNIFMLLVQVLRLRLPEIAYDLPAGGKRLIQRTDGFDATIVSGEIVYRAGEATGALPGRLIRSTH